MKHAMAFLVVLLVADPIAHGDNNPVSTLAPVCMTIDATHDELAAHDRDRASRALARVLEEQDLLVVGDPCPRMYELWHERHPHTIVVHLAGPGGSRRTTVAGVDEL